MLGRAGGEESSEREGEAAHAAIVRYDQGVATQKRFKLAPEAILPIVKNMGGCIASDRITVDGKRVAFMERSETDRPGDSGWLFTSGTEDQDYMDDPENFSVFAVNTIANYDSDIVPFLQAPPGSSYERPRNAGDFAPCEGTTWMPGDPPYRGKWPPPDFPIVEGRHGLTKNWMLVLPDKFARRIEEGALVLWRPGITLWITAWGNDRGESPASRLASVSAKISPDAREIQRATEGDVLRFSYRLTEDGQEALYSFTVSPAGHLQMAIYFDDEANVETARAITESVTSL